MTTATFFHLFLISILLGFGSFSICAGEASMEGIQLPLLDSTGVPYRTPRAGEGFQAEVFGREITVQPRDRRSVSGWILGLEINEPTPEKAGILPFGALYFWRHPDDERFLRAQVSGVYNDIFLSRSSPSLRPFEWVLTFNSFTLPFAHAELIDGKSLESEELLWGYVRPGLGIGYRRQVSPGHQDNMLAVNLTAEPGFLFFHKGSKTSDNFVVHRDTFEIRAHLQLRCDAMERNLLTQPHNGFATGTDLIYGRRSNWKNWGVDSSQDADKGADYLLFTGYFLAAVGVPGVDSDRHRLVGSVYGGIGRHLDRFSAPRVGGGYRPMGEEYGSTWQPILPGAAMQEFFPKHYLLAVGEYRWEPIFFTNVSLGGSVAWIDRLSKTETGISTKNDVLTSMGGRVVTGFFFETRLQLAYNYNFSVIRDGHFGGHEIVMSLSRYF